MAREGRIWLASAIAAALVCGACRGAERFLAPRLADVEIPLAFDPPSDLRAPDSLEVRSTAERAIVLAWSPVLVGDVAGYAILRSGSAAGPFQLVGHTRSRFGTIYTDTGESEGSLGDGQPYAYRIHPYDGLGRLSRNHAAVEARTDPVPGMPTGLTAYSNLPRRVVLTWDPSPGEVAAYAIYRSPTAAGPYERVAQVEGRLQTVYEDRVDGDLRVLYYRIGALNRFSGESEHTAAERAVTKAEPLPPIDLRVRSRRLGALALAWTPNVETDLRGYEIWRSTRDESGWSAESLIAEVPPAEPVVGEAGSELTWTDLGIGCGEPVRYRLRARDRDGLASDFSTRLETAGEDLGLAIRRGPGALELHWDPARARGWERARVEVERSLGLPARVIGYARDEPRFALPAGLAEDTRLQVVLESAAQPAELSAAGEAPACGISLAGAAAPQRS